MTGVGISLGIFLGLGFGAFASRVSGEAPAWLIPACVIGAAVQALVLVLA